MICLDHSHPTATDKFRVDRQHPKDLCMQVMAMYPLHHNSLYRLPLMWTKRLWISTWEHNLLRFHLRWAQVPRIYSHQQRYPHHRCQVTFSRSDCHLLRHCWHSLKIILPTIQIHHLCVTPGLKVQTGKALSKLHWHRLLPLQQWKSQDLFVGTVEKQDIWSATVQTHHIVPSASK